MIAVFVLLQALTLNYGTRINDLPFIRDYRVTGDVLRHSGLARDQLMGSKVHQAESLDVWMVRFKLYSISRPTKSSTSSRSRASTGAFAV